METRVTEPTLPDQQYNPSAPGEITADDIPTPWVLFAQGQTKADVPYGCIYTRLGNEATVIAEPAEALDTPGPAVRFSVLRGPQKRWGWNKTENDYWTSTEYPTELSADGTDAKGKKPHRVFDYVIALLDGDTRLPFKIRFKRTGADAAKEINMALLMAPDPARAVFELTVVKRQDDFKYVVPQVRLVEVPALEVGDHDEIRGRLSVLAGFDPSPQQIPTTTTSAPALD